MENRTVYQVFRDTVVKHGGRPALTRRISGKDETLTYTEFWDRVLALRTALLSHGVKSGDRVMILSENRPEWPITDLACQLAGIMTVPVYTTLPTDQIAYLLSDAGAVAAVVSDKVQFNKVSAKRESLPALKFIVTMDRVDDATPTIADLIMEGSVGVHPADQVDPIGDETTADSPATIIYTSGTTGDPKGAVLSQRALLHTAWSAIQIVPLDHSEVFLSFLPLCHVIERVGGLYLPVSIGAHSVYSEGVFAIGNELATVRPTVFLCVPRLFESVQQKVLDLAAKSPPNRKRLFDWAMSIGKRMAEKREAGQAPGILLALQHYFADKLVLSKIREKTTGGRARFFVSGGAPLNPETARFFQAIGVCILEGYGLTEIPVTNLNLPTKAVVGTVGPPIPGMENKIAPDGEILTRGPSRMIGYFNKPEATREAIDEEGWFRTGDIGTIGSDGYLRITDRKKDIIVLANGKNVAPQPIEKAIKQSRYIGEIVLIGDKQATISALVVPQFDELKRWARSQGLESTDEEALSQSDEVRKLLKSEIANYSNSLADFEKVKRFAVLSQGFTVDGGELTPTLKVKRRFIVKKYAEVIAGLSR